MIWIYLQSAALKERVKLCGNTFEWLERIFSVYSFVYVALRAICNCQLEMCDHIKLKEQDLST